MRRFVPLALAALMAAPLAASAQSPTPGSSVELHLCVTAQVEPGVLLMPVPLMAAIADGRALITDVAECDAPAPSSPSPDAPAVPFATTSPPTVFPTQAPRPTPRPTKRPKPTPRPSYKKLGKRAWQKLVRSPDDHVGERVQVWACISQFDAATGSDTFRGQALNARTRYWWSDGDNALFMGDEDDLDRFVEDDVVWMNAVLMGSYTYDTQIGGSTTAPVFIVHSIKRKGSCE